MKEKPESQAGVSDEELAEARGKLLNRVYEAIVHSATDGLLLLDTQGRFMEVNDAYCGLTGYRRDELLTMKIQDVVVAETPEEVARHLQQAMESGRSHFETRHRRKDGGIIDVEVSVDYLSLNGGLLSVFLHDITQRKQTEEELRQRNHYLHVVYTIERAAAQSIELDEVLNSALQATLEVLDVEGGGIFLLEPDGETMLLRAHRGMSEDLVEDVRRIKLGEGISSRDAIEVKPVVIDIADYASERLAAFVVREGLQTLASTPLVSANEIIGELDLGTRRFRAFPPEELDLLISVGRQLGSAVRNARLHEAVKQERDQLRLAQEELARSLARLEASVEGTVNAMALTSERRDPYTAGHQRRVAQLASAISREMGLPEERTKGIFMAAIIHDIGKIAVPAEILTKPGRLTELEFGIIKTHPQVGYDILKIIEFPWPVAQIVFQHQERMDGSGYPLGLSGEDILLEARIVGVADAVEAMTSHRPYRPAHATEVALREIAQYGGRLFDPEVGDACLRLFAEKGFKYKE